MTVGKTKERTNGLSVDYFALTIDISLSLSLCEDISTMLEKNLTHWRDVVNSLYFENEAKFYFAIEFATCKPGCKYFC